jgi:AcrR family transcriptional regulator
MGRPFTASDEEVLHAARTVMSRRGPEAFSIAEVANEVGLSRAAIILRFKSTRALKAASMATIVDQFIAALDATLAGFDKSPGGDNLLRLAAFIGRAMHSRESSARYFATYSTSVQDHELAELDVRRGEALHNAISSVMPATAIDHESAVKAFAAHLTGNIIAWLGSSDPDSRRHLVMRTNEWLKLARIPVSAQVVEELSKPTAEAAETASRRPDARRAKTTRSAKRTRAR